MNLFDLIGDDDPVQTPNNTFSSQAAVRTWDEHKEPPNVDHETDLCLDWETTGLRWWGKDRPIGGAVSLPDGSTHYLAWGHRGGGNNISEEGARTYFRRWRKKRITNLNTRFEIHMGREWGVSFEEQGCTVSDVGHYAALLDDHRQEHSLKSIVRDYLPDEAKVEKVGDVVLDGSKMASYHAGIVAVRAEADVRQVRKLKDKLWPMLDAQLLQDVRQLEDEFIYVVCEMEKNGTYIDMELLEKWAAEAEAEWKACVMQIYRNTGMSINPASNPDMQRLFKHQNLMWDEYTDKGKPSFKAGMLKRYLHNENVALALRAKRLKSLDSKYFSKYRKNVNSDGLLRYAIHQLRAEKDENDEDSVGTISGRCSSSAFTFPKEPDFGVNIQQVRKVAKQIEDFGDKYIIRQLHIPGKGMKHLAADAKQIEYRLFASMAGNKEVLEAYAKDPDISFHKFMWKEKLVPKRPKFTYKQTKDLNFAVIYAAGLAKMAFMLEYVTEHEMKELKRIKARRTHPKLLETADIRAVYDELLPEVPKLLKRASHLAAPHCTEYCHKGDIFHRREPHRGYVATILGRRMRFPDAIRLHKALNGVIQGSAADINKRKGIELYNTREEHGLLIRFTVHDEWDGDIEDQEHATIVQQILDRQSFPKLKVPILWDVNIGNNWRECSDD